MNGQDKKDLNVILERMDRADEDRKAIRQDIKFIKEVHEKMRNENEIWRNFL